MLMINCQTLLSTVFLQYLGDVIVGYLSSQDQWELLHTTILTILQHDCYGEGMLNVDSRV